MPGLDLFGSETTIPAATVVEVPSITFTAPVEAAPSGPGVYYNARLNPKNFLEGPLSVNAATRLRQMLARPGIVVSDSISEHTRCAWLDSNSLTGRPWYLRRHQCALRS